MGNSEILAKADFRLTGTGWNGPVDEIVHAELSKSKAFDYGNRTCMALIWENGNIDSYDTRYERVSPRNFTEYAKELLENRVLKTITVEVVE